MSRWAVVAVLAAGYGLLRWFEWLMQIVRRADRYWTDDDRWRWPGA